MNSLLRTALIVAIALGSAVSAGAQTLPTLPSGPVTLFDGHLALSGDVSASMAPDDPGFFNYTDYEHSALRLLRADLSFALTLSPHVAVLGELRDENIDTLRPYALYLRIRPWVDRAVDIQVGRVPPTFGTFARRAYATDNPLIGYPLAYQYLTPLRADALPWNADELLRMRARGWLSNFSIGDTTPDNGVPLVTAFRWDTGVQLHAATGIVDGTASVTTGTVSNPRWTDDNSAPQVAGHLGLRPIAGLVIGASAARGPFVSSTASRGAVGDGHDTSFTQTALGADFEYSRDYYLVRAETIWSEWRIPEVGAPVINAPLRARSAYVEGRYKVHPRLYVAARADHLGFSDITGSAGRESWDAPVTRIEIGGGYSLERNLLLKIACQHDARDGGRVTSATLTSAQLVYWF